MTDAVTAALAAARAASDQVASVAPYAPTVLAAPLPQGRMKTLDDAVESYVARPEIYLKVDEYGLHIEDKGIITEVIGELKLSDCTFPTICRFSRAGSAAYIRTYDGIREVKTAKAWTQALAEAQAMDPKADVYDAVDFILEVSQAIQKQGGDPAKIPPVGTKIGHTTSRTSYDNVMKTLKEARRILGADAKVTVRVGYQERHKNSNSWGVLTMELLPQA